MNVVLFSLLLIFELIKQAAFVHFMLFLNILKEKLFFSCLVGSFSTKTYKTFRTAQCT